MHSKYPPPTRAPSGGRGRAFCNVFAPCLKRGRYESPSLHVRHKHAKPFRRIVHRLHVPLHKQRIASACPRASAKQNPQTARPPNLSTCTFVKPAGDRSGHSALGGRGKTTHSLMSGTPFILALTACAPHPQTPGTTPCREALPTNTRLCVWPEGHIQRMASATCRVRARRVLGTPAQM